MYHLKWHAFSQIQIGVLLRSSCCNHRSLLRPFVPLSSCVSDQMVTVISLYVTVFQKQKLHFAQQSQNLSIFSYIIFLKWIFGPFLKRFRSLLVLREHVVLCWMAGNYIREYSNRNVRERVAEVDWMFKYMAHFTARYSQLSNSFFQIGENECN